MERFKHFHLRPGTAADGPAIETLVHTVLREYGLKPDPNGVDADLRDVEGMYGAQGGDFVLVEDETGLVGSAGLLPIDGTTAELRKMYLAKSVRGQGLGRYLMERTITLAKARGFRRLELETASELTEAIALYQGRGFQPLCGGVHTCRCDLAFFLELS